MKDQCGIVAGGRRRRLPGGRAGDGDHPAGVHIERIDWNAAARGGLAGGIGAFGKAEEHLGVGVLQKEAEFLFAITWIQRGRGSSNRCGQKTDHRG